MALNNFDSLRDKLLENKTWPLVYMFKFIAPNKDGKVDQLIEFLPSNGKLSFKHTKNLKHVSVTCIAKMTSADDIISILRNAMQIEGMMCL